MHSGQAASIHLHRITTTSATTTTTPRDDTSIADRRRSARNHDRNHNLYTNGRWQTIASS